VNGVQLIDRWIDQSATEHSGSINLVGGQRYAIRIEYYESGGAAVARLSWQSPGRTKQVIPQNRLYPSQTTGVEDEMNIPAAFALKQNYPNPFNPATTIEFSIQRENRVEICIYDLLGCEVNRLVANSHYRSGVYQKIWNGINQRGEHAASGVYFYQMIATPLNGGDDHVEIKKMMIVR